MAVVLTRLSLPAGASRLWRELNAPRVSRLACVVAPMLVGLFALWRGQDANVDLLHYHLYNAYALLHGRVGQDLSPGGMQSYFNPLLDLPFYWMEMNWPAPLAGFVLGVVQGCGFALLLGIGRSLAHQLPHEDRNRVPLLLATAGCLTTNFLTSVGHAMGDNVTMLIVLSAVLVLLRGWDGFGDRSSGAALRLAIAGAILGAGVGLKLTNAIYAPALCLATLAIEAPWRQRISAALLTGGGVLLGIAVTGGAWHIEMLRLFGNPFFPQFSNIFVNPWAEPVAVVDTVWRPRDWVEAAAWPFVFTADPHRVGQLAFHQIMWPSAYVLVVVWAGRAVLAGRAPAGRSLFLIVFIAVAYAVWVKMFSIFRYVMALEMLLPLLVWSVLSSLFPYRVARASAAAFLALATLVFLSGGVRDWGTAAWAARAFRVQVPALTAPGKTTIFFTGPEPPQQYLALFLPPEVRFVNGLNVQTPAWRERISALARSRGGPILVIMTAVVDAHAEKQATLDRQASAWGLTGSAGTCAALGWAMQHLRTRTTLASADGGSAQSCRLVLPGGERRDLAAANRAIVATAVGDLAGYGFVLDPDACATYSAFVGQKSFPYQVCAARVAGGGPGSSE